MSKKTEWLKNILSLPKSVWLAMFFVLLVIIYVAFDYGFAQCKARFPCEKIDITLISSPSDSAFPLNKAKTQIDEKIAKLKEVTGNAHNQNNIVANAKTDADTKSLEANKGGNNATFNNANLDANANLKKEITKQNIANSERLNAQNELDKAYKFMADRYSYRLIWIFFVGVFLALCIVAISLSIFIMNEAFENYLKLIILGIASLSIVFAVIAYYSEYMSLAEPMLKQSIGTDDLAIDAINLLNVIGFAAIIFLSAASCAILYAVEKLNHETNPDNLKKQIAKLEAKKTSISEKLPLMEDGEAKESLKVALKILEDTLDESKDKLEKYEPWRERLRLVLYISAIMLFVNIFRFDVVADWHRLFVSDEFNKILEGFLTTILSVQAGFYTILILLLYVPVDYFMPSTDKAPGVQDKLKEGIIPTIKEFLPRAILLVLPLLAEPISKFIKYFFPT